MAMRVATRRVADQLRCSPAVLNGTRLFQNSGPDAQQGAPKPVPMSKLKDSFLDGTSSTYLEDMEERYRQDPSSVDKSWASFFRSLGKRTHAAVRAEHHCAIIMQIAAVVLLGRRWRSAQVLTLCHCIYRVWSSPGGRGRGLPQLRDGWEGGASESRSNV